MKKNRSNLVLSLLSLVFTSFLLVFTIYSWYTSNIEVSSKGIVGQSANEKTDYELDYWDGTEWKIVSKIEKNNVLPGSTTYYRLKCINSSDTTVKLTAKFEGIESRLDTLYVKVSSDGKKIRYNGIDTYNITSNQVTVPAVIKGEDTKTVLYNVSGTSISLKDFKIEEGYIIQRFGSTETKTGAVLKRDNITSSMNTVEIGDNVLENQTIAVGTSYYYFALTFLDDDDIDSYYMYQSLYIASLTMIDG